MNTPKESQQFTLESDVLPIIKDAMRLNNELMKKCSAINTKHPSGVGNVFGIAMLSIIGKEITSILPSMIKGLIPENLTPQQMSLMEGNVLAMAMELASEIEQLLKDKGYETG